MSRSGKNILYIFASLLLLCAVMEIGFRLVVPKRSSNMRTILALKQADGNTKDRKDVVILGNSFTLCGIDAAALQKFVQEPSGDIRCVVHALSGSQLSEWYWMAKLHVLQQDPPPDELILNAGPQSLKDGSSVRHRRLALIFGNKLPFLPENHLRKQSKEIEFLLARTFLSVNRGRNIGGLLATMIFPGHKKHQAALTDTVAPSPSNKPSKVNSYSIFKAMHAACEEAGVDLKVVLMPHRSIYSLDPELLRVAQSLGVEVVDAQITQDATYFEDPVHLNKAGRAWFTERYADLVLKSGPKSL